LALGVRDHGERDVGLCAMTNLGPSPGKCERDHWKQFDSLPIALRRALSNAPYDYAVMEIVKRWRKFFARGGRNSAKAAQLLEKEFKEDAANEVRRVYGFDHPQATVVIDGDA
jgi:hypothetical protein